MRVKNEHHSDDDRHLQIGGYRPKKLDMGAVNDGEWDGVALRDVLSLAGIVDSAVGVLLVGLDAESPEEGFR